MLGHFCHRGRIGLLALVCATVGGCAVFDRDNRPLLNALDEKVQPEGTWERVALAPVMIPVAGAAVTVDAVIIHPVQVVPEAADDVYELYWKPREETLLRKSLLFVPCLLATPPTFVGDWLVRAVFDADF